MASALSGHSEQKIFDDLGELCASQGYIHVLASISLRDNTIGYRDHLSGSNVAASYASDRTVRTEFSMLLGLLLKHGIDTAFPSDEVLRELAARTRVLLDELHGCLGRPMAQAVVAAFGQHREIGSSSVKADVFGNGDVLREPIFYGGESAYSFQYREFSLIRYRGDDAWLVANKGFGVGDARQVAVALARLASDKLTKLTEGGDRSDAVLRDVLPGFCFGLDEVADEARLATATAEAVLAAFTAPVSPTNAGFKSLGDYNEANAFPIVRLDDGKYCALQTYGVGEALYESPFYWMAADKSYKETAFANRGAFTEEMTAARLAAVFGRGRVHRGVDVMRRGIRVTEVDVLILFANRAIVVQCKSKKLTLLARKGNDLRLRDDFKKSVQDAYDQARLCAVSLCDRDLTFVGGDGREVAIPELRAIYPVCVVSDHYPALTVQARQFLVQEVGGAIRPAFVADVFLVDVLAEMLASPLSFLSYLDRRVGYGDRIFASNELSILGHHLRRNLWIGSGTDVLAIGDEGSIDLDAAMTVRREGLAGSRTPEGILDQLDAPSVNRLMSGLERGDDEALVSLGLTLLKLGGEALFELALGIEKMAYRAAMDGKLHDITVTLGDGIGLTAHSGTGSAALADLAIRCRRSKYRHRASLWYGLQVRPLDRFPISGLMLDYPWEFDPALDEATAGMPDASQRRSRAPETAKLGRNVRCTCGSGRKYKRCCGP